MENITIEQQIYIQSKTPLLPIVFINVNQEFDEKLNRTVGKYSKSTPNNTSFNFGYKCMCRFWFYKFINYTSNYKYVIRIDEDCIIYSFLDNICNIIENNSIYFYTGKLIHDFDDGDHAYGIEDCINEFINENNINHNNIIYTSVPYTNFCIIDVEYFKNCDLFNKWCNYISNEGGIFVSRWGDANLWGIYLYMSNIIHTNFMEDSAIKYFHGTHNIVVN